MNLVDLGALLLAAWLGARGYVKGFLREGMEAASAILGVVAASRAYWRLGDAVAAVTGLPVSVTRPVMYAVVAVSVTAIGFFITNLVHTFMRVRTRSRTLDDFGGLAFGILKGLFFAALLVVLVAQIPSATLTRALYGSAFGRAVMTSAPVVYRQIGP